MTVVDLAAARADAQVADPDVADAQMRAQDRARVQDRAMAQDRADPDSLWEQARVIAGRLNLLHAELAEVTARVIAAEAWGGQGGVRSPEHWLALRAGLAPSTAEQVTALASARDRLPVLTSLVEDGRLSLDQAAAIATRVPPAYEEAVCELAPMMTVSQLRRTLSRYPFEDDDGAADGTPDGKSAAEPEPSSVSVHWDNDRCHIHGSLDAADGALVENALREAKDALVTAGNPGATLADALVEIASRSLGTIASPARAAHYRVFVHLDTEGAWLNGRGTLSYRIAERLGCVASAQAVWHTDGQPVSVGRAQRAVPERTRRLVVDRDRGCAYPGCTVTRFVEIHHIEHWEDGGGTDYDNLICLCPFHHTAHHAGKFTIGASGNPMAPFTFTARWGYRIHAHPPEPIDHSDASQAEPAYASPLGERLDTNWITFSKNPA